MRDFFVFPVGQKKPAWVFHQAGKNLWKNYRAVLRENFQL